MPELFAYLKSPSLENLPAGKRILIIELSEQRIASVLLRRSTIWTFALVVGLPPAYWESQTWAAAWRAKAGGLSGEDARDLRRNGETPFGVSIIDALKAEMQTLCQSTSSGADFILPVGDLCRMKNFVLLIREHFPKSTVLQDNSALRLPNSLSTQALREEISKVFRPALDGEYSVMAAQIENGARGARLRAVPTVILPKGGEPPNHNGFVENVNQKTLYRTMAADRSSLASLNFIVKKDNATIFAARGTPPRNKCVLQYWITYADDKPHFQVCDDQNKPVALHEIASTDPNDSLPPIESKRCIDIAFIVDGTMRSKSGSDWKPDIEPARQFLSALLTELQNAKSLDVRVALSVYGDRPITRAEYLLRELPQQANGNLTEPRILERDIRDPGKFRATFDLDYEAMLEAALLWANRVKWRGDLVSKNVVVIGNAPPHLHKTNPYYPLDGGLVHEPLTSDINFRDQLVQLRANRVHVFALWVPPPELDATHPCLRWSKQIWQDEIANRDDHSSFVELTDETRGNLLKAIVASGISLHVAQAPVALPLAHWELSLRWAETKA